MQCFLFPEAATRNKICYQTEGKAISAGFKAQNPGSFSSSFREKKFALSKYSPVTLHYSPATIILNEIPEFHTDVE